MSLQSVIIRVGNMGEVTEHSVFKCEHSVTLTSLSGALPTAHHTKVPHRIMRSQRSQYFHFEDMAVHESLLHVS